MMFVRLLGRTAGLASVVAMLALTGCADATFGPSDFLAMSRGRGRWVDRGPSSYRMTVSRSCECLPEWMGPAVVNVVDGVVMEQRYVATGGLVPVEHAGLFPSVEGLFALIEEARRTGVKRIEVGYDPVFGYPDRITIDPDGEVWNDDIVFYRVADFQPS
jgi:hypothetical protein